MKEGGASLIFSQVSKRVPENLPTSTEEQSEEPLSREEGSLFSGLMLTRTVPKEEPVGQDLSKHCNIHA